MQHFNIEQQMRFQTPEYKQEGDIWIISRHPATIQWLKDTYGIRAKQTAHMDRTLIAQLNRGDTVIANLPERLAAEICRKGINYCVINLNYDDYPELRGEELDCNGLEQLEANLEQYCVRLLSADIYTRQMAQENTK